MVSWMSLIGICFIVVALLLNSRLREVAELEPKV
jgi:hypothetical protein